MVPLPLPPGRAPPDSTPQPNSQTHPLLPLCSHLPATIQISVQPRTSCRRTATVNWPEYIKSIVAALVYGGCDLLFMLSMALCQFFFAIFSVFCGVRLLAGPRSYLSLSRTALGWALFCLPPSGLPSGDDAKVEMAAAGAGKAAAKEGTPLVGGDTHLRPDPLGCPPPSCMPSGDDAKM